MLQSIWRQVTKLIVLGVSCVTPCRNPASCSAVAMGTRHSSFKAPGRCVVLFLSQAAHNDFWQPALEASASFLKPFQFHSLSAFLRDSGLWVEVSGMSTVGILWIGDIRGDNAVAISVFRKSLYFWLLMKLNRYRSKQEHWSRLCSCLLFCSFHQGHFQ